jgi:hypothetical protein
MGSHGTVAVHDAHAHAHAHALPLQDPTRPGRTVRSNARKADYSVPGFQTTTTHHIISHRTAWHGMAWHGHGMGMDMASENLKIGLL